MSDPYDPNQPPTQPPAAPEPGSSPPPPPYGSTPLPAPPPYPAPPYPAQGYPAPGPPAPGYPAQGYPAQGYPAQPGYPPPGYGYGLPELPYAHWGLRLAGYLLDTVLVLPFTFLAAAGLAIGSDPVTGDPSTGGAVLAVITYLAALAFSIWNQILRQGRTGQSLGKQWVGIRLIREVDGRPLGGWLTFGRGLLHILDALPCYVGFLWPLWDGKRQTFADMIVKSVVVRADRAYVPPVQAF